MGSDRGEEGAIDGEAPADDDAGRFAGDTESSCLCTPLVTMGAEEGGATEGATAEGGGSGAASPFSPACFSVARSKRAMMSVVIASCSGVSCEFKVDATLQCLNCQGASSLPSQA